jgi:hypothetical protein
VSHGLRAAIDRAGGLATLGDLARRWNVSRVRAHEIAQHPDFPEPVATISDGTTALYAIAEADKWRNTPRRPGPRPKS